MGKLQFTTKQIQATLYTRLLLGSTQPTSMHLNVGYTAEQKHEPCLHHDRTENMPHHPNILPASRCPPLSHTGTTKQVKATQSFP